MKTTFLLFSLAFMAFLGVKAQTPCNANFTFVVNPSGLVTFTGTPGSSTTTYTWSFGNGTAGFGINTSTIYNAAGNYTVCLVVQDSSFMTSCIDTSCVTITIGSVSGCQANFVAFPDSLGPAYQYLVYNMSTGSSLSYIWNWGDGTPVSNGPNPSHIYPGPGTYNICLYIDNGAGCLDTFCQTVTVTPVVNCNAQFSLTPNNSPSALPFTFDVVNNSLGSGLTYTWVWGDGSPNGTGANPSTHVYPAAGTYTACLYISNSSGCTDSSCITVTATTGSTGCMASFSIAPDTSVGAPAHTYIGYNTSSGTGLQYLWMWGDGTSSTGAYPSHTYAAAGNYTICLIVTGAGCVDSFCMTTYLAKTEAMVTVNFLAPSGLNDVVKEQASIYPNPADKELYLNGDKSMTYSIEIYNLNGMRVLTTTSRGNEHINISALPANFYMVRIADREGKQQFAKFMKK